MKFKEFDLPEPLLRAVEDLGFEEPTPIQEQALPHLLGGRDLAGQAQTGTGKTACFLLAAMTRLHESDRPTDGRPRALIVAPTRELALQISDDAHSLARYADLGIVTCYGGTGWEAQARQLQEGCDIVVGTPGRLIDYLRRGILRLDRVESFILDEADRMFDMGFIKDITFLFRHVPPKGKRQALLFSATLSQQVLRLAWRFMVDPVEVAIRPDVIVVEAVEQELLHVGSHEKFSVLLGLLQREQPGRSMIFVNTKRMGEALCWRLNHNGHLAVYMSGDIPQNKRTKIIEALKAGKIDTLVATDVASRGIHVDDITHVFNYDVPLDPEDYVHRIGRTARAGATGKAITLACEEYVLALSAVEKYIESKIPSSLPTDELMVPDRAGYFRRKRGKTYCGWPLPGEGGGSRDADRVGEERDRDRDRDRDRGGRKRKRRRGRGDGERAEAAPQEASSHDASSDNAAPTDSPSGEATEGKKKSRRRRSRGGDGGSDQPAAAASSDGGGEATERPPRKKRKRERRRIGDGRGIETGAQAAPTE